MLSLMNVYVWILYCRYMYPCKWRACSTTVAAINNYIHFHLSKPHTLQERSACCFTDVWGALIAQALTYTIQLDALSKYGMSWCLFTDAAFTQPKSWKHYQNTHDISVIELNDMIIRVNEIWFFGDMMSSLSMSFISKFSDSTSCAVLAFCKYERDSNDQVIILQSENYI